MFKCLFRERVSQLPVIRNSYGQSTKNEKAFVLTHGPLSQAFDFKLRMMQGLMVRARDRRSCSHQDVQEGTGF